VATEGAGPRKETMAEAATLLGARRGIKVVGVDGSGMPDAETADGGFLPGPHAKLAGPTFKAYGPEVISPSAAPDRPPGQPIRPARRRTPP
jgi:hypothetical protein